MSTGGSEASIRWDPAYDTGHAEIDRQHRELIGIINRLIDIGADRSGMAVLAVFEELSRYVKEHFSLEEELMRGTPALAAQAASHVKAHRGFVATVDRARPLIESHPEHVVEQLAAFLVRWLLFHIAGQDRRMVRLLEGGAVGALEGDPSIPAGQATPLVDLVNDLYDSLGRQTFEILGVNRRLEEEVDRRKELEVALRTSEERWKLALEAASEGAWDWNLPSGTVVYSPTWKRMLGYRPEELGDSEQEWLGRIFPDDREVFEAERDLHLQGRRAVLDVEFRLRARDGELRWIRCRGMVFSRDAAGRPVRMLGTMTDVTDRKTAEMKVVHDATHDRLTGLPNRTLLRDRAEQAVARTRRTGACAAFAFLDLDGFKPVNDTAGHGAGDAVLVEIAGRLRAAVRATDTIGRVGGDEFVALLPDLSGPEVARQLARRLLEAVRQPVEVLGREVTLSVSIGLAYAPEHGTEVDALFHVADTRMYQAKSAGGNQVVG